MALATDAQPLLSLEPPRTGAPMHPRLALLASILGLSGC
jgi:hypothetical protein